MKKSSMLSFLLAITISLQVNAQTTLEPKIDVFDFHTFKAHVFTSPETMGDISLIVEGPSGIIIVEPQAFVESIKLFKNYIASLNKPVVKIVANYHVGGLVEWDPALVVMIEGMPEFEKSPRHVGMIKNFAERFGNAMDLRDHEPVATIPVDTSVNWGGVTFQFSPGPATDFPAASIGVGGKVYYTHFAPSKGHPRAGNFPDKASVNQEITRLKQLKNEGYELFTGSHGAPVGTEVVDFQIGYYQTLLDVLATASGKEAFITEVMKVYPDLGGEDNLPELANNFYK
ncbi:MAG: hypothetical protein LIP06_05180 [Tannerellaceae bacterium]|nr:hypothetical protein [Tannerellaceae bacterium]